MPEFNKGHQKTIHVTFKILLFFLDLLISSNQNVMHYLLTLLKNNKVHLFLLQCIYSFDNIKKMGPSFSIFQKASVNSYSYPPWLQFFLCRYLNYYQFCSGTWILKIESS